MSIDATRRLEPQTQAPIMTTASTFVLWVDPKRWQEAIDFFETTIGLILRTNEPPHWAEFGAGKMSIGLHPTDKPEPKITGLVFDVENCDKAVAALKARGVKIGKPPTKVADNDPNRCFEFLDPFGNTFLAYGA